MRVIVQQVDLDTCLAALIMGVQRGDEVIVVRGRAKECDLADPSTLCVEVGGAGRTAEQNFDHHEPGGPTDPACRQAYGLSAKPEPSLARLVDYVAAHDVDGVRPSGPRTPDVLNLSALFSGMRLVVREPVEQLFAGLDILRTIVEQEIDPAGAMPDRPEWRAYAAAKRAAWRALEDVRRTAEIFATAGGLRAGFVETDTIGALGELYAMDCEIAIAYSARFRPPSGGAEIAKYTIGGRDGRRVDALLPALGALEVGWGGPAHGTIVASPRMGTRLAPEQVKHIVQRCL